MIIHQKMCKLRFLGIVLVILSFLASCSLDFMSGDKNPAPDAIIKLQNNSDGTITEFYIKKSSEAAWGENFFASAFSPLESSSWQEFPLSAGTYSFRVRYSGSTNYYELLQVSIRTGYQRWLIFVPTSSDPDFWFYATGENIIY